MPSEIASLAVLLILFAVLATFAVSIATAATRIARLGELVPYQPGPRAKVGLFEFLIALIAFLAAQYGGAVIGYALAEPTSGSTAIQADVPNDSLSGPVTIAPIPPAEAESFTSETIETGYAEVDDPEADAGAESRSPRANALIMTGASAGTLLATIALLGIWNVVLRRGPRFFGDSFATFREDVGLGIWTFLIIVVPTYALQAILFQLFPQKHEILESLDEGFDATFFAAAAFSAVLAAPIAEEIVFRGFLLSSFSHVRRGISASWTTMLTGTPTASDESSDETTDDRIGDSSTSSDYSVPDDELDDPYRPPAQGRLARPVRSVDDNFAPETPAQFRKRGGTFAEGCRRTLAGICSFPVVASAAVFALLHVGQGPAPITLFFFALALGYLFRQTGRLTASVTAHFALNGTTMLLAALAAFESAAN